MSQLGTTVYIRGDDKSFRGTLASAENSAEASFKRMGASAKESFGKGLFGAKEMLSRSFGLITGGPAGFGAAAAFTGLVSAAEAMVGHSMVAAHEAEREVDARRRSVEAVYRQIEALKMVGESQRQVASSAGSGDSVLAPPAGRS